jgi:hypothetical protein
MKTSDCDYPNDRQRESVQPAAENQTQRSESFIDKMFDTVITGEPDEPIRTPRQIEDEIQRSKRRESEPET